MSKGMGKFYVRMLGIPLLLAFALALALHGGHEIDAAIVALLLLFYVGLGAFSLRLWRRDRNASR